MKSVEDRETNAALLEWGRKTPDEPGPHGENAGPPAWERAPALLPAAVFLGLIALWVLVSALGIYKESTFPPPLKVVTEFQRLVLSGRMLNDIIASLFRVAVGFLAAVLLGV